MSIEYTFVMSEYEVEELRKQLPRMKQELKQLEGGVEGLPESMKGQSDYLIGLETDRLVHEIMQLDNNIQALE